VTDVLTVHEPTVIWDLDGTMLNSLGVLEDGLAAVLPGYGIVQPSHDKIVANYHGSLEESVNNILGGVEPVMLKAIVTDFLMAQDTHFDSIEDHLYPDALQLAKRLHDAGKQQLLVTNREHIGRLRASPRSIVANTELSRYIDAIVCGDDGLHRKPKPEVLDPVRSLGRINLDQVIVIGDQFVDAELAHNLGARAILVSREGDTVPYLERLADGWEERTVVTPSLLTVQAAPIN
jgi:phosphoglycolate phosphatase-like HAD superfamily hydrolase